MSELVKKKRGGRGGNRLQITDDRLQSKICRLEMTDCSLKLQTTITDYNWTVTDYNYRLLQLETEAHASASQPGGPRGLADYESFQTFEFRIT